MTSCFAGVLSGSISRTKRGSPKEESEAANDEVPPDSEVKAYLERLKNKRPSRQR